MMNHPDAAIKDTDADSTPLTLCSPRVELQSTCANGFKRQSREKFSISTQISSGGKQKREFKQKKKTTTKQKQNDKEKTCLLSKFTVEHDIG